MGVFGQCVVDFLGVQEEVLKLVVELGYLIIVVVVYEVLDIYLGFLKIFIGFFDVGV